MSSQHYSLRKFNARHVIETSLHYNCTYLLVASQQPCLFIVYFIFLFKRSLGLAQITIPWSAKKFTLP
jgi:hypothetical protein